MPSHYQLIANSIEKAKDSNTPWGNRHWDAWEHRHTGRPIISIIQSLAAMADNHASIHGSPIGEDYVTGPVWAGLVQGVRDILDKTETGTLDCGTVDSLLVAMLKKEGLFNE